MISANPTIDDILAQLKKVRATSNGWEACCPCHEDKDPSLSITQDTDGTIAFTCHAGCSQDAIRKSLGLEWSDLFPPRKINKKYKPLRKPSKPTIYPTANEAVTQLERQLGKRFASWTYTDLNGDPVGVVVRWNLPNGKKDIRPVSRNGRGWVIGAMQELRPLYNLVTLRESDGRLFVVEGEPCCEALRSIGLITTTSSGGSNAAHKTDWQPLVGRDVVILPDADDAGRRYADDVARILTKLNPPAIAKIIELPGLPPGGDIVDWIEAHDSTESDDLRRQLEALANAAKPVEVNTSELVSGPILVCLADVEPRPVTWLWPNRIPMGRITLLVGRPSEGKSFATIDIAARITTGSPWPDKSGHVPKGSVILISAEDDPHDMIRPRLNAHNADARKVHLLSTVQYADDDGRQCEAMFTLADIAALEESLKRIPDCKLIIVDPIGSFLGGRTDAHRDNEVRAVLAPVARLAEKYGPAVIVVTHRRKSSGIIADDLARLLRDWLHGRPTDMRVFATMPEKTAKMIKADLRRARAWWIKGTLDRHWRRTRRDSDFLAVVDHEGRIADFHALRVTYITLSVKGGTSVKITQELARHSDPKLTMNVYSKLGVHDLAGALNHLPSLIDNSSERQRLRATGTDNTRAEIVADPRLYSRQLERKSKRLSATSRKGAADETRSDGVHKSLLSQKIRDTTRRGAKKPPVGFEPTTCGLQNRCSDQLSYGGKYLLIRHLQLNDISSRSPTTTLTTTDVCGILDISY